MVRDQHTHKPDGQWDRVAKDMLLNFAESGHPIFRGTSAIERGILKSKGGGKTSFRFSGDSESIEVIIRTVISADQLSIYGAVEDMCEESIRLFSEVSTNTTKPVAREELETGDPTQDVSSIKNSRPTNDTALGNALLEYRQKIEDLPEDLRIHKISSEAGFIRTVVPGQYLVTLGDKELAKLDVPTSCDEYTLPRNEKFTRTKGWIRENTKNWFCIWKSL